MIMDPMDSNRRRCTAKSKRSGEQCKNTAIPGGATCRMHGGAASQVRRKAATRLAEEHARQAVITYGLPRDIDPAAALLEEVHRTAGHVAWLAQKIRELDDTDLTWGITEETDKTATLSPGTDRKATARPSVWLDLYHRERRHLVHVSKTALDAGISERLVHLAEQQGAMLADVIRRSTDSLLDRLTGLLGDQDAALVRREWPGWLARIVPEQIAAVTGAPHAEPS